MHLNSRGICFNSAVQKTNNCGSLAPYVGHVSVLEVKVIQCLCFCPSDFCLFVVILIAAGVPGAVCSPEVTGCYASEELAVTKLPS